MRILPSFSRKAAGNTLLRYFLSYFIIFSVLIAGFLFVIRSQLAKLYLAQLTIQSQEQSDRGNQCPGDHQRKYGCYPCPLHF